MSNIDKFLSHKDNNNNKNSIDLQKGVFGSDRLSIKSKNVFLKFFNFFQSLDVNLFNIYENPNGNEINSIRKLNDNSITSNNALNVKLNNLKNRTYDMFERFSKLVGTK